MEELRIFCFLLTVILSAAILQPAVAANSQKIHHQVRCPLKTAQKSHDPCCPGPCCPDPLGTSLNLIATQYGRR